MMARLVTLRHLAADLRELSQELPRVTKEGLAQGLRDRYFRRARQVSRAIRSDDNRPGKVHLGDSWERYEKPGRFGVRSRAPHGAVIDRGRRRSKKAGKMLGSKKAKAGIVRPIRKEFERRISADIDRTVGKLFKR